MTRRGVGYYMRNNDWSNKTICHVVELCLCSDYGWVYHCSCLASLNRRDNIKHRQPNIKLKIGAGIILKWSTCKEAQRKADQIWPTVSNDLSEVIRLTHENLEQETKRRTSILAYMTDGVLATNRRGQIIMVNEMAAKQLNVNPDEVLNTSILDLLSIEERYDLRKLDYWSTRVNHRFPRS